MRKSILLFILLSAMNMSAQNRIPAIHPLDLEFQRLAVRRFIFSNNINLSEFVPSEIVAFESMHPAFAVSGDDKALCDTTFAPRLKNGKLILDASSGESSACFYVGSVNPYAAYDLDIESVQTSGNETAETGIDLARYGLRDRVQVIACSGKEKGIFLRVWQDAVGYQFGFHHGITASRVFMASGYKKLTFRASFTVFAAAEITRINAPFLCFTVVKQVCRAGIAQ